MLPHQFSNYSYANYIFSLQVGAILDHFGYPTPSLTEWQQHIWYDLGAMHSCVYKMRNRLAMGRPPQPRSVSPVVSATTSASSVQFHPRVGQKAPRAPAESTPVASTPGQPAKAPLSCPPPRVRTSARGRKGRKAMPAHKGPRSTRRGQPLWLLLIQRSTRTRQSRKKRPLPV